MLCRKPNSRSWSWCMYAQIDEKRFLGNSREKELSTWLFHETPFSLVLRASRSVRTAVGTRPTSPKPIAEWMQLYDEPAAAPINNPLQRDPFEHPKFFFFFSPSPPYPLMGPESFRYDDRSRIFHRSYMWHSQVCICTCSFSREGLHLMLAGIEPMASPHA